MASMRFLTDNKKLTQQASLTFPPLGRLDKCAVDQNRISALHLSAL